MLLLTFLLSSCCLSAQVIESDRPGFSSREVKEDLTYLYKTLRESHYNLYAYTPRTVFDSAYREILANVRDSLSLLQVHRVFQQFAALSNIGHCTLDFPATSYRSYLLSDSGKLFPLDIVIRGETVRIYKNHSGNNNIRAGDQLIAINGKPVSVILDEIFRYISGERFYYKSAKLELYSLPRMLWYVYGESNTYNITVKTAEGQTVETTVHAIPGLQFEKGRKDLLNTGRLLRIDKEVAYLHPGQFLNATAAHHSTSDVNTFNKEEFLQFLDSAFLEIHKHKAGHLVIDLRNNPGGDNSFSDAMVAYFAKRPFKYCSRFMVRTSHLTKTFWKDVHDSQLQYLKEAILTHKNGERFTASLPENQPRKDALRFNGSIYILINRHSYSNAATTAAMIQDYDMGQVIGEETADLPTTYAAVHQFNLPHTKITVTYPKAYMVRPGGSTAVKGTVPDYKVSDDVYSPEDEVLTAVLQLIGK